MCNRSLKQTAISLGSCEAEFYAASACAGELVGTRRTLQGNSRQRFISCRNGFRLGKTHSTAQGTRWTQTHRDTILVNTAVDTRENVYP